MFDRYLCIILSSLSVLMLTSAVKAEEIMTSSTTTDNSIYIGAKAGWMHYQNACEDWNTACDGNDTAYGFYTGYQFTQHFALEAAYLDLGQAVATYPQTGLEETYVGAMTSWELAALGRFSLSENWDIFAKLGTVAWQGENQGPYSTRSDSGWAPMAGLGFEYHWSPAWTVRAEYQYINQLGSEQIGGSNGHLTTLGVHYRFGQRAVVYNSAKTVNVADSSKTAAVASVLPASPSETQIEPLKKVILFTFDSSALQNENELEEVLTQLHKYPNATILIKGYTDSIGAHDYNQKLSMSRALTISDYLIEKGVQQHRIKLIALGESSPVSPNNEPLKRYLNRRVELEIPALVISETDKTNQDITE